jgi:hypothetical protein
MILNDFRYSPTLISPVLRADPEIPPQLSASGGTTDTIRVAHAEVESFLAKGDNLSN